MRYSTEHVYEAPIELVVEGLMEKNLCEAQALDGVQASRLVEERDEGTRKHFVYANEWDVRGKIPGPVRNIVKPHMVTFIERAVWDRKALTYTYTVEPHFFKKTVLAGGVTSFREKDHGSAIRRVEVHIEVKLPLIGGLLENWLIELMKNNIEQDFDISSRALYAWLEGEGRR